MNHLELGGRQHHRHLLGTGQVRKQFRVSGIDVSCRMQRFLVQRRRADRLDFTAYSEFACDADILIGRISRDCRQFTPGEILG